MNKKKLEKAWPVFEEICREQVGSGYVNIGYLLGGALPFENHADTIKEMVEKVQRLTEFSVNDHPDSSLSADEYGRALHSFITPEVAESMDLEVILLPTGEVARRLKKLRASYLEYLGLVMVLNDWHFTLVEELVKHGFSESEYTDEELNTLINRSIEGQAEIYLDLLEHEVRGGKAIA